MRDIVSHLSEADANQAERLRRHVETCPDCSTELARFNELKDALASLAATPVEVPAWLEGRLSEVIFAKAARMAALRRVENQARKPQVLTGGALLAAGIAGAMFFRSRRRRRTLRPRLNLRHVFAQA